MEPQQPNNPVESNLNQPLPPVPPQKKSNTLLYILLGVLLVLLLGGGTTYYLFVIKKPTKTETPTVEIKPITAVATVSITKDGFVPATIQVAPGTTVTWENTDTVQHQVASDPYPSNDALSDLNSEEGLAQNESYSYTFTKAGTYAYHDNLNPYTFKGVVVVK